MAGSMNLCPFSLLQTDSISKIKNATNVLMIDNKEGDHPKTLVNMLRKTGYIIKCPPYVNVDNGVSKLPIEIASIKNDVGYMSYEN